MRGHLQLGYMDTLKISDAELAVIVAETIGRTSNRRRWIRRPTDFMRMKADVDHPGGSRAKLLVRSFDLSEGGVGFFTGNYLHPSTQGRLTMQTTDNENVFVDGEVARCVNLRDKVHLVGFQFDSQIDLSWFGEEPADLSESPFEEVVVTLEHLRRLIEKHAEEEDVNACYERLMVLMDPILHRSLEQDDMGNGDEIDDADDSRTPADDAGRENNQGDSERAAEP